MRSAGLEEAQGGIEIAGRTQTQDNFTCPANKACIFWPLPFYRQKFICLLDFTALVKI